MYSFPDNDLLKTLQGMNSRPLLGIIETEPTGGCWGGGRIELHRQHRAAEQHSSTSSTEQHRAAAEQQYDRAAVARGV